VTVAEITDNRQTRSVSERGTRLCKREGYGFTLRTELTETTYFGKSLPGYVQWFGEPGRHKTSGEHEAALVFTLWRLLAVRLCPLLFV
jgi:hypothetical protein